MSLFLKKSYSSYFYGLMLGVSLCMATSLDAGNIHGRNRPRAEAVKPDAAETRSIHGNDYFGIQEAYAVSIIGRRSTDEDRMAASYHQEATSSVKDCAFFGLFDGHGGTKASIYAQRNLARYVREMFQVTLDEKDSRYVNLHPHDPAQNWLTNVGRGCAIEVAFKSLDKGFCRDLAQRKAPEEESESGSTLVAVVVGSSTVYVAHAGDSRALVSQNGRLVYVTEDHKPDDAAEKARIETAGGFVESHRVCGNIAVSRGLGDSDYKKRVGPLPKNAAGSPIRDADGDLVLAAAVPFTDLPFDGTEMITSKPVVKALPREGIEFIIEACDGLFESFNNEQVFNAVRLGLAAGIPLKQICQALVEAAYDKESGDNISVQLIVFNAAGYAVKKGLMAGAELSLSRVREVMGLPAQPIVRVAPSGVEAPIGGFDIEGTAAAGAGARRGATIPEIEDASPLHYEFHGLARLLERDGTVPCDVVAEIRAIKDRGELSRAARAWRMMNILSFRGLEGTMPAALRAYCNSLRPFAAQLAAEFPTSASAGYGGARAPAVISPIVVPGGSPRGVIAGAGYSADLDAARKRREEAASLELARRLEQEERDAAYARRVARGED